MVRGRIRTEHHPSEVGQLSRRREQHRTAVVDGRAQIVVPIESIDWDERSDLRLRVFRRWFPEVTTFPPGELTAADSSASIVVDRFAFVLYLGDACEVTGTHDGDPFVGAAAAHPIAVLMTSGVDVRRSRPEHLVEAASTHRVRGALVDGYVVETVSSS